jgi:endoglucanase
MGNAPGASDFAKTISASLTPGVNLGNILEAPADGAWGDQSRFSNLAPYTEKAWAMGFKSVRLPVRWSNHASTTAPYTIEPAFMTTVKNAVTALNNRGFVVVLNMHHYAQLDGDDHVGPAQYAMNATQLTNGELEKRMVLMWKQIANEFKGFPRDKLIFEVYNEPHKRLQSGEDFNNSNSTPWNNLLARAMGQIRVTNPDRVVVVGPAYWNNAAWLNRLVLPRDANLIVTIHHYEPFNFTHQGASWINPTPPTGQTCCSAAQLTQIRGPLDTAKAWSDTNRYPIWVGEFGAYGYGQDDNPTVTQQRVNFNNAVRTEAVSRGMSWSYWEFAAGFGVYNPYNAQGQFSPANGQIRTTLLQSLIPPTN